MCDEPMLRRRFTRFLLAVASALVVSLPTAALAQLVPVPQPPCGPEVKAEIVKALSGVADADKLAVEQALYDKYQFCAYDGQVVPSSFYIAARECGASVSHLGSLYYEELSCAGYDPQRRQFAAPIKIKLPFGFGWAPLPGSREHVLHCVADATGTFVPVARDSVHLSDSQDRPTWQFAVIANANQNLHTVYPMDGQTRWARSILSWELTPTHCDYKPIWGNALNYRIRLDQ